ncbi:MAG: hypothetical protein L0H73_04110 [Nitrococcus sp.]|nr:hypothetical protein [Nitrococcus sp.]
MDSLLYTVSEWAVNTIGYKAIMASPLLVVLYIFVRQLKIFRVDLLSITVALSAMPMLTPLATRVSGYRYFTEMNFYLQDDLALKTSGVLLISIFVFAVILGAKISFGVRLANAGSPVVLSWGVISLLFFVNLVLLALFLESGTIVFSSYGQIKTSPANWSSFVNQFFNLSAAVSLTALSTTRRLRLTQLILAVFIILALLMSRRTLALGLIVLLLYTFGTRRLTAKHFIIAIAGVALLWAIGEMRTVGIVNFLQGAWQESVARQTYSMPGGGANIFLSVMGMIHLVGSGTLAFPETVPILLWPKGIYESTIYESYGYMYNGGTHIAAVLYWNCGLVGVFFGGVLLGRVAANVSSVLSRMMEETGGTLSAMLSVGFVLLLPNTLWYNPVAVIKLSGAVICSYFILTGIKFIKIESFHAIPAQRRTNNAPSGR